MICPRCHALNPDEARFCESCGGALATAAAAANTKACLSCGQANEAAAAFCGHCGARMEAAPPASKTCTECGAVNKPNARFCGNCGITFDAPPKPPAAASVFEAQSAPESASPVPPIPEARAERSAESESVAPALGTIGAIGHAPPGAPPAQPVRSSRSLVIAIAAVVAILALGAGAYFFYFKDRVASGPANLPAAAVGESATVYATRLTRMRDAPTSAGSTIVGNLNRGDAVSGVWIVGADGTTRWLKVAREGQSDVYVWGVNLSPQPRPRLERLIGAEQSVITGTSIHAEPGTGAPYVDTLTQGTVVTAMGLVRNDAGELWVEIALRGGGVGYVPPNALQAIERIDAQVTWPNGWDTYTRVEGQCRAIRFPDHDRCILQAMKPFAPSTKAYGFAERLAAMDLPGWAGSYTAYGKVDLIEAEYPFRANTNTGYLLVNGEPAIVNVESFTLSERDKQAPAYRAIMQRHPEAFLANHQGFVGHQPHGTGQRFIFVDTFSTCRACDPVATAEFAYDFDATGRLVRTQLLALLPPDAAARLVTRRLPPR